MLLFVVLTPGIVLTLPPVGKKIFGTGKSNFTAACVHAVIFVVLLNWFRVEGFAPVPTKIGIRTNVPIAPYGNSWSQSTVEALGRKQQAEQILNNATLQLNAATQDYNDLQEEIIQMKKTFETATEQNNQAQLAANNAINADTERFNKCKDLGCPDAQGSLRIYTRKDCDALGGTYHMNGECTPFSYECRHLNQRASPNGANCGNFAKAVANASSTGNEVTSYLQATPTATRIFKKNDRVTCSELTTRTGYVWTSDSKYTYISPNKNGSTLTKYQTMSCKAETPPPPPPPPPPKIDISGVPSVNYGPSTGVISNSNSGSSLVKSVLSAVGLAPSPVQAVPITSGPPPGYKSIGPAPQPVFGISSCPPGQIVYYNGQTSMCA